MKIRIGAVALVIAALAGATACQAEGGNTAAKGGTESDKLLKHVKCLQEHGVAAELSGEGIAIPKSANVDEATLDKAERACADTNPMGPAPKVGSEEWDKLLKFAQCLRENGLSDVEDPKPGDPRVKIDGRNYGEEAVDAAQEACREYDPHP